MKKTILLILVVLVTTLTYSQNETLKVKPTGIQVGFIVDTNTISFPEVGDIVLNIDSNHYAWDGVRWKAMFCECNEVLTIPYLDFNGMPSQANLQTLYGLPVHNFDGYIRNDMFVFNFVYIADDQKYHFSKMNH